jgi:hypothetical protein
MLTGNVLILVKSEAWFCVARRLWRHVSRLDGFLLVWKLSEVDVDRKFREGWVLGAGIVLAERRRRGFCG